MKGYLRIENVGPIRQAEINLKKINVFVGPQSSGKSTIAKIISFCQWLDKDVLTHQSTSYIDEIYIKEKLMSYHNMESYFSTDSVIYYESEVLTFHYSSLGIEVEFVKSGKEQSVGKIAYVPSERNLIAIPNITSLNMGANYIRSYLFEWFSIHSRFQKDHSIGLLNLGMKYTYDEASKKDIVEMNDGSRVTLSDASSGMQSIIPMIAFISYVTNLIFSDVVDISYERYAQLQKVLVEAKVADYSELSERLSNSHFTNLIIEEPELNIFPATQYEFVKWLIAQMDNGRDNTLTITTHSPYIITALNNLIQASIVANVDDLTGIKSTIAYDTVNAFYVSNGNVKDITDDEFQLISTDDLDAASDMMSEDFNKLIAQ